MGARVRLGVTARVAMTVRLRAAVRLRRRVAVKVSWMGLLMERQRVVVRVRWMVAVMARWRAGMRLRWRAAAWAAPMAAVEEGLVVANLSVTGTSHMSVDKKCGRTIHTAGDCRGYSPRLCKPEQGRTKRPCLDQSQ